MRLAGGGGKPIKPDISFAVFVQWIGNMLYSMYVLKLHKRTWEDLVSLGGAENETGNMAIFITRRICGRVNPEPKTSGGIYRTLHSRLLGAEQGPVVGRPQLVTQFSDFKRNLGCCTDPWFGGYQFLAYAVGVFERQAALLFFNDAERRQDTKNTQGRARPGAFPLPPEPRALEMTSPSIHPPARPKTRCWGGGNGFLQL